VSEFQLGKQEGRNGVLFAFSFLFRLLPRNQFRLIGNSYFAFVDGCWVAVDVDGFVYMERVICAGDPEFIEVE
jgi:hypothetical protein